MTTWHRELASRVKISHSNQHTNNQLSNSDDNDWVSEESGWRGTSLLRIHCATQCEELVLSGDTHLSDCDSGLGASDPMPDIAQRAEYVALNQQWKISFWLKNRLRHHQWDNARQRWLRGRGRGLENVALDPAGGVLLLHQPRDRLQDHRSCVPRHIPG